jgi:hypothetical protein
VLSFALDDLDGRRAMKKLKLRGVYFAVLGGAIAGAAIGIPAWAASSGGDSSGGGTAARPVPPPRVAPFGLEMKGFPTGAEAKKLHKKMDEFATCMREHGADIPGVDVRRHGMSIQVPRPKAAAAMKKAANECGLPPPPAPDKVFPLSKKQIEKNRKAIARGDCPFPPALPRRK